MSSTHGKVIEREHAYGGGTYRHLEMSDGTYAAIPAGMVCEVGDVVMVVSDDIDILKRKAAAFDAIIEHGLAVVKFQSKWAAYGLYGKRLASGHDTPLEAVESAVKKLGET